MAGSVCEVQYGNRGSRSRTQDNQDERRATNKKTKRRGEKEKKIEMVKRRQTLLKKRDKKTK
jgi:hypothetical protein